MGVGGGGQVELRGGFCFQRFPAALTFLVAAAFAVSGRLLVNNPITQLIVLNQKNRKTISWV